MSKTVQQFECRDDVWKRVVALAKRRGISTDEVVQAALVNLFKRKKNPTEKSAAKPAPAPEPAPEAAEPAAAPEPRRTPTQRPAAKRPAPPAEAAAEPPRRPPRPRPPTGKGLPKPGGRGLPKPGGRAGGPPPARPVSQQPAQALPLYLFCEGQWYTIDQDQFVIGRGSKFSDLPIKDANISRRHAAVVRRNGEYFIKDLGSTNGIEFNGERVDDHRVDDGSVYYLCDHELRFTFTSPS